MEGDGAIGQQSIHPLLLWESVCPLSVYVAVSGEKWYIYTFSGKCVHLPH